MKKMKVFMYKGSRVLQTNRTNRIDDIEIGIAMNRDINAQILVWIQV